MKWYTKVWNWIKGLFKRFKFDNKLFALGVDWAVSETLKVLGDDYTGDTVVGIVRNFGNTIKDKFKKFPQITSLVNMAQDHAIDAIESKRGYAQMKLENKIKFVGEAVKDWYNENL